jgi:hypothetical protein
MRSRISIVLALAALAAAPALAVDGDGDSATPPRSAASGARSPWFLGIAVSPEGFAGDLGLPDAERLSLALVLDPFQWKTAVPSLAAGLTTPLFPWLPEDALFEARLDLRVLTLRSRLLDSLYDGPAEYSPALTASVYLPLSGGEAFGSFGVRPLAFRTGDAAYSLFSVSTVMSRGPDDEAAYNFRGFSIELFEFTHFFR